MKPRVQKQTYKYRPEGKTVAEVRWSRDWYLRWTRPDGKRKWVRLCGDKRKAEQMAEKFLATEQAKALGLVPAVAVSPAAEPLEKHVAAFEADKRADEDGLSDEYIENTVRIVRRIVADCGFHTAADIDPLKVNELLQAYRDEDGGGGRRFGAETRAKYRRRFSHFCDWLVENGRLAVNPMPRPKAKRSKQKAKAKREQRHKRRSFEPFEFVRLTDTTAREPRRFGLSGRARALLYTFAAFTGLRSREAGAVRWSDFTFGAEPVVRLAGDYTKNGEDAVLPLRADLAAALEAWWHERGDEPDTVVWTLPRNSRRHRTYRTAVMLKRDLAAAGIEYVDADGRHADFHSLRATLDTWLLKAGVSEHAARKLMRHAGKDLTTTVYADTTALDYRHELDKLPVVPVLSQTTTQRQAV